MKELIEKMREAATLRISKKFEPWIMKLNLSTTIGESGLQDKLKLTQREIERQVELVEPILVECAKIAASHYENKWVSVLDEGTPFPKSLASRIGSISEDVIFMADGLPRLGFYDYIGKTWQAQGFKTFKGADVTIWHPLPELPTPPNSDKNV